MKNYSRGFSSFPSKLGDFALGEKYSRSALSCNLLETFLL